MVVPAGQSNRYARASNPAARITAWRTPAAAASVNNSSNHRVRTVMPSAARRMLNSGSTSSISISPSSARTKKSSPTARTSGSANGSSIRPSRFESARCAATIVAVAPTLDARSQVSLSVRAISGLLFENRCEVAGVARECGQLVLRELETVESICFSARTDGDVPALRYQVVACAVTVAGVEQLGKIDVGSHAAGPLTE